MQTDDNKEIQTLIPEFDFGEEIVVYQPSSKLKKRDAGKAGVVDPQVSLDTNNEFLVTINYDLSLAEMIQFVNYDQTAPEITEEHFPIEASGTVQIPMIVVDFGCPVETDEAIKALSRNGLRPATLPELIAFDAQNTGGDYLIVALGSRWRRPEGFRCVTSCRSEPIQQKHPPRHYLRLEWFGQRYYCYWRFLASVTGTYGV